MKKSKPPIPPSSQMLPMLKNEANRGPLKTNALPANSATVLPEKLFTSGARPFSI
jgi:hypothetical protein